MLQIKKILTLGSVDRISSHPDALGRNFDLKPCCFLLWPETVGYRKLFPLHNNSNRKREQLLDVYMLPGVFFSLSFVFGHPIVYPSN